jgi:predicted small lipoprotein YifL
MNSFCGWIRKDSAAFFFAASDSTLQGQTQLKKLANVALLFALSLAGCGSNELGPADPSATPKFDDPALQESMNRAMDDAPEEMRKKYGQ